MLASKNVGRKISYRLKKTTSELYSASKEDKIDDAEFNKIVETTKSFKNHKIYYVEVPGTVQEVRNTIIHFSQNEAKGKWLIVIIDHTLLTRGRTGDKEREILADLQYMFMELKKYGKNTIIELSQLNREIETVERINNNFLHFPMRRDIFGSEAVYQSADYVIVLHRPEIINIQEETGYGPFKWPVNNLIYMHLLSKK